jgi:hypothetical protein
VLPVLGEAPAAPPVLPARDPAVAAFAEAA